jgi:hypothetical protein
MGWLTFSSIVNSFESKKLQTEIYSAQVDAVLDSREHALRDVIRQGTGNVSPSPRFAESAEQNGEGWLVAP